MITLTYWKDKVIDGYLYSFNGTLAILCGAGFAKDYGEELEKNNISNKLIKESINIHYDENTVIRLDKINIKK